MSVDLYYVRKKLFYHGAWLKYSVIRNLWTDNVALYYVNVGVRHCKERSFLSNDWYNSTSTIQTGCLKILIKSSTCFIKIEDTKGEAGKGSLNTFIRSTTLERACYLPLMSTNLL